MKIINKFSKRLSIIKFYYKYVKFGIFYIILLSFITGALESIGISLLFPILQSILEEKTELNLVNFSVINNFLSFFKINNSIKNLIIIFIGLFVLKAIFKFITGYIKLIYSSKFLLDIRKKLINDLSVLDFLNYTKRDTGKLSSTFTHEVENMVSGFIYFSNYLVSIFTGLSFIFIILFIEYKFAFVILFFGFFYYISFKRLNIKIKDISKEITKSNSIFNSLLIQFIQSYKYLKSTNNYYNLGSFLNLTVMNIRKLKIQKDIRTNIVSSIQEPAVLIIIFFIIYISVSIIKIEKSIVFMLLIMFYRSTNYLLTSQSIWNNFLSQIGSTNSVIQLENSLIKNREIDFGIKKVSLNKSIILKNINFKYSKEIVFNNLDSINIEIPINKTIAFVGKSGSGKSTLINIITGLLKPNSGSVLIDGVDLSEIDLNFWRSKIGYISQESVIFNDTILNNITSWSYTEKVDYQRLWNAINMSHLNEIITNDIDLNRHVGDRGISLSGGQKQRIAIARELYRLPKILILDEATSALDSETENSIIEGLEQLNGKITIIAIAHRLSTIKNSNIIYVMEKGKIIEYGNYEELIYNNSSRMNEFISMQKL